MDYEPGFAQITTLPSPFPAIVPFRENADRRGNSAACSRKQSFTE